SHQRCTSTSGEPFHGTTCSIPPLLLRFLFFFNDTATTEIYTLSLHDALPISLCLCVPTASCGAPGCCTDSRSEEHTSELQSLTNLVCRLLLEKKTPHARRPVTDRRTPRPARLNRVRYQY